MPLAEARSLFDSATFRILVAAVDHALARACAEAPSRNAATTLGALAEHIIGSAKSGERDEERLIVEALARLRQTEQIQMSRRRVEAGESYAAKSDAEIQVIAERMAGLQPRSESARGG